MEINLKAILAISVGAVLGANLRYLVSVFAAERLGTDFPYGTLFVNVTGSVAIGFFLTLVLERFDLDVAWRLFATVGFLGAYTTFSAYTWETATLLRQGAYGPAVGYLVGSVVVGIGVVLAGILAAERR